MTTYFYNIEFFIDFYFFLFYYSNRYQTRRINMNTNIFRILKSRSLVVTLILIFSTSVFASTGQVLQSNDFVGITFWLISMALVASTAFFFLERDRVSGKWKTSLTVSGLECSKSIQHYALDCNDWMGNLSHRVLRRVSHRLGSCQ